MSENKMRTPTVSFGAVFVKLFKVSALATTKPRTMSGVMAVLRHCIMVSELAIFKVSFLWFLKVSKLVSNFKLVRVYLLENELAS